MNQIKGLSLATPLQKSIAAIVGVAISCIPILLYLALSV
jgi:hypothetical protein